MSSLHLCYQQFFKRILFHDVSLKIMWFCMTSEINQVHKIRSLVLNREAEWTIFVLNRSGFEDLSGTPPPKLPLSAPYPLGGSCADSWHVLVWLLSKLLQERSLKILIGTSSSVFGIIKKKTGILWNGVFLTKKSLQYYIFTTLWVAKVTCHKIAMKIMAKKMMQNCLKYNVIR